jgi:hypothetical protein
MLDAQLIVVHEIRSRRGALERTYMSRALPLLWGGAWPPEIGDVETRWTVLEAIKMIASDVSDAFRAGTLTSRPGWRATRVSRAVDERGWSELAELHRRAFEETLAIVERAAQRLEQTTEEAITVVSGALLFEADSQGE